MWGHKQLRYCLRIQEIWLTEQKDHLWILGLMPGGNSSLHNAYVNQLNPGGWMNLLWKMAFPVCKYVFSESVLLNIIQGCDSEYFHI